MCVHCMQCVHTLFACLYVYVFVYACSFTMCVGIMYMHILYASVFMYMHALYVSVYACIIRMCMYVLCASIYVYMHTLCASVNSCLSEEIFLPNISMARYCHHAVLLDIQKLLILHNENWVPFDQYHTFFMISYHPVSTPKANHSFSTYYSRAPPRPCILCMILTLWHCLQAIDANSG